MIVHRGRWVLPIASAPIADGWVAVERGQVVAVGGPHEPPPAGPQGPDAAPAAARHEAILPGLVNAHVHLELSWMRGRVPPSSSMPAWAARLMKLRRTVTAEPAEPIAAAIADARAAGTALVGDVTNTLAVYEPLVDSDLSARIFRELLGFSAADPARLVADALAQAGELMPVAWLRTGLAPHAPYSVSPGLFRAIAAAGTGPLSVHLAESPEELEFLRHGHGAWRDLLEELGAWNPSWQPPGCGTVEYLAGFGLLNERLVAVHGVQLTDDELGQLAAAGATLVTCPRSNQWTGAGLPPIERFYASGVRVAVGTDSLASVDDLSVFAELSRVRMLAPGVPAGRLLRSATLDGAAALGFGDELGSIEPGKRADLLAVRVPPQVADVEEYLVRGVPSEDIRWLDGG